MSTSVIYTCPMHPEVQQDAPGNCPKCGMHLEPKVAIVDADKTELHDMATRFWICLILTIPIIILSIIDYIPGKIWIELGLATPVMLWGAAPFFKRAWISVVTWNLNMFTLIALGTGVAYIYSIIATVAPGLFPATMRMQGGIVNVYFEAAAAITVLVLLGQVLELRARSQTSTAIRALLNLVPKVARIIRANGTEEDIMLEKVVVGDKLRIRPGEAVPVDGVIISGTSTIDESMITGESMPVIKSVAADITGGTLNQTGSFVMVARMVGNDTVLSQIVHMVAEAQRSRAPIQKLADIVAGYFVPIVILISILTAVVWGLCGPEPRLSFALVSAVSVLIIACPCAIGLATPMSIMVGIGRGASAGVLIKNAESLEMMEKINVLVIDKTGTLTEGHPKLTSLIAVDNYDLREMLQLVASLEKDSEHPLATAIVNAAKDKGLELLDVKEFQSLPGKGVVGIVKSQQIALGNSELFVTLNINTEPLQLQAEDLRKKGETVMLIAIANKFAGIIAVADPIKQTTPKALRDLRACGIRIVMLTGDNEKTAKAIADQLEIDEVEAGVLPARKSEMIKRLQGQGYLVAMAGDGVNDAAALAQANVSIAMGTGADIAMESSAITLVKGDLDGIVRARNLSKATMRNIRQNLFFAFIYNSIGIPIAAGILYPLWGILLNPMIGSAAMVCSSVSVILNALRLNKMELIHESNANK